MKKTLIISTWAPPSIGGPKNMHCLFSQFPRDSYCILTSYYGIDNYSAQNGDWLPGKYYFYDNPAFEDVPGQRSRMLASSPQRDRISSLRHLAKRIGFVKAILGPFLILGQILMIIRLGRKAIRKENVKTLFGVSDFGPALISTYFLSRLTNKPIVLHLYDLYKGNLLPFPGNLLASFFEPRLISRAEKIIVTNEGTRDYYIKRYGNAIEKKLFVIHNSVSPEPYAEEKISEYNLEPPYSILFAGRIYWPQAQAIRELIDTIKDIKLDIKFNIYSPNPKDYLEKLGISESDRIAIRAATPQEMPSLQAKADILFLPLSWNTKAPDIIRTATPGKLTDYLATGRPILIYAPNDTALVKYARENNFAYIVDVENKELLQKTIIEIITNKEKSLLLIENARKTFIKDFDAKKNSGLLAALLR